MIGGQRQFIAAAGRGAVDDGDETLAGILAGILQPVAGLVGEFAEIDLVGVGRARQHADVGAGAEHPVLGRAQQHHLDAGMLEAQPLHRVGEFDVDAEIVGIQLELIALEQPAILVDIHGQRRDVAIDIQLPVPVARRIGLKIDVSGAASEDAIFTGHWATLRAAILVDYADMHNNACFGARSRPKAPKICILFHVRLMAPIFTQSALDSSGCASLVLQQRRQRRGRKAVGKSVAAGGRLAQAERVEFAQRLAEQPRRRVRLLHPQPQIGVGDLDAGPQQDPLAAALRRRRPHRFQDLLRFPEIAARR